MARLPGISQAPRVKPACKDCGHGHHLVWMHDQWLCPIHLKIKKKEGFGETEDFHNLFPNRAARRYAEKEAQRERRG